MDWLRNLRCSLIHFMYLDVIEPSKSKDYMKCRACKGPKSQMSTRGGRLFFKRNGRNMGWI